jgi:hypothetical protein
MLANDWLTSIAPRARTQDFMETSPMVLLLILVVFLMAGQFAHDAVERVLSLEADAGAVRQRDKAVLNARVAGSPPAEP